MTLTLAQARTILDKTLAAAREKKFKPLGVAVVDNRGALRTYAEEDGSPILRSRIASGKAFGAVAFGQVTAKSTGASTLASLSTTLSTLFSIVSPFANFSTPLFVPGASTGSLTSARKCASGASCRSQSLGGHGVP